MTEAKKKLPSRVLNADGSETLYLREPLTFGEESIDHLIIKKPKAKHLKGVDLNKMGIDTTLAVLSKLTGQFPQALEELGMADLGAATEVVKDFLADLLQDGKTS